MPRYSDTIAAALQQRAIGHVLLGRFGFPDGERLLHNGSGVLRLDGEDWHGLGAWGGVSPIATGIGDAATQVSFTLSGVDEQIISLAAQGSDAVRGGEVTLYERFFDAETRAPLDTTQFLGMWFMDRIEIALEERARSVTLICEGYFTSRSKPPAGMLSHIDQQHLFPGDKGLEFQAKTVNKSIAWPIL